MMIPKECKGVYCYYCGRLMSIKIEDDEERFYWNNVRRTICGYCAEKELSSIMRRDFIMKGMRI